MELVGHDLAVPGLEGGRAVAGPALAALGLTAPLGTSADVGRIVGLLRAYLGGGAPAP